jgi:hypothetical protein
MPIETNLLSYLAGFIDADGSISIVKTSYFDKQLNRKRFQYRIKLSAHNCKIEAVKVFQDTFGVGKLRDNRTRKILKDNPKWRPCYEWTLWSNQAQKAIESMLPFLRIKKPQALLALELQNFRHQFGTNDFKKADVKENCEKVFAELKEKCILLNKRGQ